MMSGLADRDNPAVAVLAGPTGAGKGTVSAYIREFYPQVWLSVSATTRPPRPGEREAIHYYYKTPEDFKRLVEEGAFLEWACVHGGHLYGTLKSTVEHAVAEGRKVLLEIDIQGARQVREKIPDALFVFLVPPSWEVLVERLRSRGTESKAEQQNRLKSAKIELASEPEFDLTIVNDTVERAAAELLTAMKVL